MLELFSAYIYPLYRPPFLYSEQLLLREFAIVCIAQTLRAITQVGELTNSNSRSCIISSKEIVHSHLITYVYFDSYIFSHLIVYHFSYLTVKTNFVFLEIIRVFSYVWGEHLQCQKCFIITHSKATLLPIQYFDSLKKTPQFIVSSIVNISCSGISIFS